MIKVGDRIRVTQITYEPQDSPSYVQWVGKEGVVEEIRDDEAENPIKVRFEGNDYPWWFCEDEVKLAETSQAALLFS